MVLLGRLNHAPDLDRCIGSTNCPPDPPKTAQDDPKMAKTTPKTTKNDARTPQDDPKTTKKDAKRAQSRPKQDKTKIRQERTRQDASCLLLSLVWSGLFPCLVFSPLLVSSSCCFLVLSSYRLVVLLGRLLVWSSSRLAVFRLFVFSSCRLVVFFS